MRERLNKLFVLCNWLVNSQALRFVITNTFLIALFSVAAYADSSSTYGNSTSFTMKEIAEKIVDTVFIDWRLPICTLLFIAGLASYFSSSPNGKARCTQIGIGMGIYFVLPYVLNTVIKGWGGAK